MEIGFVGLGPMGAAMASRLLQAGHALRVWNRSPDKAAKLVEAGARAAASPKEAAQGAGLVMTSVADDSALEAVTLGEAGVLAGLGPDALHASMSTVSIRLVDRLAEAHGPDRFVSAPVLGRPPAAARASCSSWRRGGRRRSSGRGRRWTPSRSACSSSASGRRRRP